MGWEGWSLFHLLAHTALRLARRWLSKNYFILVNKPCPSLKSLSSLDVEQPIRMGGGEFAPEGGDSEERKEAGMQWKAAGMVEG